MEGTGMTDLKKRARWLWFVLARKSMKRDQEEDDKGMPPGSWMTAIAVVLLLVATIAAVIIFG